MKQVLIITVEHQSSGPTNRMKESLRRIHADDTVSLLVVRNDSAPVPGDNTPVRGQPVENVWIHESTTNQGYFGGAKQGLEWFRRAQGGLPTWIIVCNNDVRIEQADFFEQLSRLEVGRVGVIAPKIISCRTGLNQNPFMVRRPGRSRIYELRFWLKNYYLAFLHEKISEWKKTGVLLKQRFLPSYHKGARLTPKAIYASHGSFLIFSRQFFECGGFLDDGSFLYHEEISVAELCKRIGLPVLYCPELCVLHDEHSTTGRSFNRSIYECQKQSLQYLTTNYFADLLP